MADFETPKIRTTPVEIIRVFRDIATIVSYTDQRVELNLAGNIVTLDFRDDSYDIGIAGTTRNYFYYRPYALRPWFIKAGICRELRIYPEFVAQVDRVIALDEHERCGELCNEISNS